MSTKSYFKKNWQNTF